MPFLLLSGLAAGADIWAAEEALDRGIPVLGCLAMPQAEYEKDFTPDELARFRSVLARCWDVIVVGNAQQRDQAYVDVANFIAYYCNVLVAFWDGLEARGRGGTAEVVELRKTGLPSAVGEALVAYVPDTGPVVQIVTPRRNCPRPAECFSIKASYPEREVWGKRKKPAESAGEEAFDDAIGHLEQYNRDISQETAPAGADQLVALRDRTDAAANRLQRHTARALQSVYIATGLAGAAQLVLPTDGSFNIPSWAGIAVKIGFLAIAFVVLAIAKRNDFENRYQDYRAIAEALRVQHAWCCAGLRNRLVEASYLEMQQSELEWIRMALRTAFLITDAGSDKTEDSVSHPVPIAWVEGQRDYYARSGKREERNLRRCQLAMIFSAVAGGAISGGAALCAWLVSHGTMVIPGETTSSAVHILGYWAAMPFALGSLLALLIRFYAQQRGFAENARRYHHMFVVFDTARRRLDDPTRDPRRVLEQLGHESLSEHADWLILHRERPLSFVHA